MTSHEKITDCSPHVVAALFGTKHFRDQFTQKWLLEPADATALEVNQVNDQISARPNPVQNTLFLTGIANDCSIKLLNLQGQVVLSLNNYNENGIDVSFLPKGIYILNVTQGEQVKTLKVLIN